MFHIDGFNEGYLITIPALHIEGLIGGSPYVELNGATYIISSSGFTSKIDYSGKGWLGGKKNSFTASMYQHGKEKDPIYTVEGQWTDSFTIKDAHKRVVDTYEAKKTPKTPLTVSPLDKQDPLESRRAWAKVASAIEKGDMNATAYEKSIIENQQRDMRKKEQAEGRGWQRRFFTKVDKSANLEFLMKEVPGGKIEADQTGGIWEFDQSKAQAFEERLNTQ